MILTPRSLITRFCSTSKNPIPNPTTIIDNPIPVKPRPRRDPTNSNLQIPLKGFEPPVHTTIKDKKPLFYDTQITTLENGLRVASQPRYGKYCTIGVAISAGSRFEQKFTPGTTHFLDKLGFMPSKHFESRDVIVETMEKNGGLCDSQSSRDTTIYAVSCESKSLPLMLKLIASTVLQPIITTDMLSETRQSIIYEQEDMELRPEQEIPLTELIHSAAWGTDTLGISRFCSLEHVDKVLKDDILSFMRTYYAPARMVVAGVGIDHQDIVDLSREYFDFSKAVWNVENFKGKEKPVPVDTSVAKYRGGMIKVEKDFGTFNSGPLPIPSLAHLAIGLESIPHSHPDFIPTCVLNLLMGGGGSFSAGGPGKGMYSRLYRNILNQYSWANSATAYNSSYADSGMFSVYGSCPPNYLKNLIQVIVKQIAGVTLGIRDQELQRSKTQLKSMLLMNLESRPIVFEDLGRQILANGIYKPPDQYIQDIEKVKAEDLERIAAQMLNTKPCIAAIGNLYQLPSYEDIQSIIKESLLGNNTTASRKSSSRFNLFGKN